MKDKLKRTRMNLEPLADNMSFSVEQMQQFVNKLFSDNDFFQSNVHSVVNVIWQYLNSNLMFGFAGQDSDLAMFAMCCGVEIERWEMGGVGGWLMTWPEANDGLAESYKKRTIEHIKRTRGKSKGAIRKGLKELEELSNQFHGGGE